MRKVNLSAVKERAFQSPKGKYQAFNKDISLALGREPDSLDLSKRHPFDLALVRLPPGATRCPYHAHSAQWELYLVVSGTGRVRDEGGVTEVSPGDAFLFGPGEAHHLSNPGQADLVYYVIADNPIGTTCYYPDSKKWMVGQPSGRFTIKGQEADYFEGEDRDPDACRVARMSLAIALLDYADPPDVSGPMANFQLPALAENNIRQKDFFELDPAWPRAKDKSPPQWIIGNPPWVELKTSKRADDKRNKPVWEWFDRNKATYPTSGNQIAEAFVWRVRDFSRPGSVIGLVLPAMTLFKHEAQKFRQTLFSELSVWCVTNFANLAYVLFAGANRPAACLFYRPSRAEAKVNNEPIVTIAPFVVEQRANQPSKPGGHH